MGHVVTVESADGTPLAAAVSGTGPPMVLVHGTTDDRNAWMFVQPLLAEHFQVWAYDRRGRGDSGDAAEHSLEREVQDVLAVLAAAGDRPHLVGHSFGAVCALEAARVQPDLASLTLYEPPVHTERVAEPIRRTISLLHAGQTEQAALVFLPEAAGLSQEEIDVARSIPEVWSSLLTAAADTFEREATALTALPWDPDRYASITTPTLHVTGELTDVPAYLDPDELRAAIPQAEHVVIPGQRHLATIGAPEPFAAEVVRFATSRG